MLGDRDILQEIVISFQLVAVGWVRPVRPGPNNPRLRTLAYRVEL